MPVLWRMVRAVKVYLAGINSRRWCLTGGGDMEVFLAGLTQGNLSPYFKTLPDRFDKETMEGNMKVFLAGDVPY